MNENFVPKTMSIYRRNRSRHRPKDCHPTGWWGHQDDVQLQQFEVKVAPLLVTLYGLSRGISSCLLQLWDAKTDPSFVGCSDWSFQSPKPWEKLL
jgi:hypothetical protein